MAMLVFWRDKSPRNGSALPANKYLHGISGEDTS